MYLPANVHSVHGLLHSQPIVEARPFKIYQSRAAKEAASLTGGITSSCQSSCCPSGLGDPSDWSAAELWSQHSHFFNEQQLKQLQGVKQPTCQCPFCPIPGLERSPSQVAMQTAHEVYPQRTAQATVACQNKRPANVHSAHGALDSLQPRL